ncbi:methylmalonyl-CoA mutase family protein [Lewinella sp. JB7]|uniref:methylmalonyl-CoA mutase family protein n=1 Tax=Lewinella sp. JB7 TaxID=2962887 RepID=UPI0020C9AF12|nr:methylmalonyl-CoA mutase family protein [Lewinella sp. JB7]MCP9234750.1 methylmalonyl-CoA mutase family protein [Lewinella sp. JB7]
MLTDTPTSFPPSDKADWLSQVTKELKGRDVSELDQEVNERIRLSPLYTAREVEPRPPLQRSAGWEIGAYVNAGTNREVNRSALTALDRGAEALLYRLYRQPGTDDIPELLADVRLDYISLHCALRYPGQDPAELFRDLVKYLRKAGYDLADIRGSVDFDPLLDWSEPPFPPLLRLLDFVHRWMPGFRVLQVNAAGFNNGPSLADTELALAIAKGAEYLQQARERGAEPATVNKHLQFAFTVGTSYYVDIAKLRALRILWANVLRGFGIEDAPPAFIAAHTDHATLSDDRDANLLRLTTQALAAVTGGADQLFLSPAEGGDRPATPFGHRMALNIQHLLRLESGLDAYADPAAGSHYLEKLTEELVNAAWDRFRTIEAQGGFAVAVEV